MILPVSLESLQCRSILTVPSLSADGALEPFRRSVPLSLSFPFSYQLVESAKTLNAWKVNSLTANTSFNTRCARVYPISVIPANLANRRQWLQNLPIFWTGLRDKRDWGFAYSLTGVDKGSFFECFSSKNCSQSISTSRDPTLGLILSHYTVRRLRTGTDTISLGAVRNGHGKLEPNAKNWRFHP